MLRFRDGLETVRLKYERLAKIPSKPPVYGEIHIFAKIGKIDKAVNQYQKLQTKTQDPIYVKALCWPPGQVQAILYLRNSCEYHLQTFLISYSAACNPAVTGTGLETLS